MSGDYQTTGWQGRPRPVFDLDPVQTLMMIGEMNQGLIQHTFRGDVQEQAANFFAGAVVNPFKYTEGETLTQYLKLRKKIVAGARFVITQLGYDARKMEELLLWLRDAGLGATPAIANVFLLTVGAARMMRKGTIAGCHISDELMAVLEEEAKSEDKGRAARCLRAAKMIAVARGLGYAGVHIGGFGITVELFNQILDTADFLQSEWHLWHHELSYGSPGGFYVYEPELGAQGQPTGRNLPHRAPCAEQVHNRKLMGGYGLSRFFHHWVLTDGRRFNKVLARVMDRRESKRGLHRPHGLEHLGKTMLYGCLDCGDCGLEACVYTCPMTGCPKCQRNGPCGGSTDGWCEVYPKERYCIWFKAYHRLKKRDALAELGRYITPPNNWDFYETSGWSNYTHHRDNAARRIPLDE
jgi:methylenetetrahydrofolate reductase (NADPH)